MGTALALASATAYGVTDVLGGLLSRRTGHVAVALFCQLGSCVFAVVLALAIGVPRLAAVDVGWGALSGVGSGLALLFLFRGLGRGDFSVVVPVSAVTAITVPVLVGAGLLGERPTAPAWLGIACAVPALWLVSAGRLRPGTASGPATLDGLASGLGVALQYLALARAGGPSGLWPLAAGRTTAVLVVALAVASILWQGRARLRIGVRRVAASLATGALAALALLCYQLATRHGFVTLAAVLASLYPVIPVVLGVTVLRERLSRGQWLGLAGAGAAIVLVTLG